MLRGKGFQIYPWSPVVMSLPPGCAYSYREAMQCLRRTLKLTYLPLCVCDYILKSAKIVARPPDRLKAILDNTKQYIRRHNGGETFD